jgi:hypothetical protein
MTDTFTGGEAVMDHAFASEDLAYEMILRQIDHGMIPVFRTTDHPVRLLPKAAH